MGAGSVAGSALHWGQLSDLSWALETVVATVKQYVEKMVMAMAAASGLATADESAAAKVARLARALAGSTDDSSG